MMKQQILVVDDDTEIARLLRGYLEKAGFEVLVAHDGVTAVQTIRREKPDLILLDLMLPDMDGYDITRVVRGDEKLALIPIIMVTARVEDTDKVVGLEVGADDYVAKPFNPTEVVARVRAQLRVKKRLSSSQHQSTHHVITVGELQLNIGRRELKVNGRIVDLTPTEFNLMRIIMESPGYVFTRSELIEKGLGYEYIGMDRTLDSHVKNLRRKIEQNPKKPTIIQTVYGIGYRLSEQ